MRLRAVLTDLDGTVLEADGRLHPDVAAAWRQLVRDGVPVIPVSSKTSQEIAFLLASLGCATPAGGENGGVVIRADGAVRRLPGAVAVEQLRDTAIALRESTRAPLKTFDELGDDELGALTGLAGAALSAARARIRPCHSSSTRRGTVACTPPWRRSQLLVCCAVTASCTCRETTTRGMPFPTFST